MVKLSSGMPKTFSDTRLNWSCVTRCGCRTTSSNFFTEYDLEFLSVYARVPSLWARDFILPNEKILKNRHSSLSCLKIYGWRAKEWKCELAKNMLDRDYASKVYPAWILHSTKIVRIKTSQEQNSLNECCAVQENLNKYCILREDCTAQKNTDKNYTVQE